jgi:predicted transcriptional regulator
MRTKAEVTPATFVGGLVLGPLEAEIMAVIWKREKSTILDVMSRLSRPYAYTTIVTTLKRLAAKGLLKRERTFTKYRLTYFPACTEREWQQWAAREAVRRFLATPNVPRELLISSLQETIRGG